MNLFSNENIVKTYLYNARYNQCICNAILKQADLSKFAKNADEIDSFVKKLADDEAKERKERLKWQSKANKLKLKEFYGETLSTDEKEFLNKGFWCERV